MARNADQPATGVDSQTFRDVMASVCAPVTVVTTLVDGVPHGSTVSAFASLSLRPPMVSVALDRRSRLLRAVRASGMFGVHVLHRDQHELAARFALRGIDRFAGLDWQLDSGLPRIAGAGAWVACDVSGAVDGGDHVLLLGTVERAVHTEMPPLTYARRTFGTHAALPPPAASTPDHGDPR